MFGVLFRKITNINELTFIIRQGFSGQDFVDDINPVSTFLLLFTSKDDCLLFLF